jgi:uncharacterized protein YkwD
MIFPPLDAMAKLEYQPPPESGNSRRWAGVVAAIIILLILTVIVVTFVLPNIGSMSDILFSNRGSTSSFVVSPEGGPSGSGSTVEISYPSNYAALANYSLSIINQDRASAGLSPVTLSPIPSGQQHADSMLQNNYFSHWDTQGYKPYMRYSILNGTGFVEENVAYESTTLPTFTSTSSVEAAISSLEWQMMNNDSACCQNGHRDNILTSFHNRVSIGVAFNPTNVYFVEDFETYLTTLSTPIDQGGSIILSGNTSGTIDPTSILIFYDAMPQPLTSVELNTEYSGPYDQGTFTGGVVPPCSSLFSKCLQFAEGMTVQASTWQVAGNAIDIQFPLSSFVSNYGTGVYTISLVQGSEENPEYLTSISVFVTST